MRDRRAPSGHGDRGEGASGYLAVILLVAAITGGAVTSGAGHHVTARISAATCRVVGDDCDPGGRRSEGRSEGRADGRPSRSPTPAPAIPPAVVPGTTGPATGPTTGPTTGPAQSTPPTARDEKGARAHADPIAEAKALAAPGLLGANDWSCKPSAAHPRPVVLVHGTFANGTIDWPVAAPTIALNGYCVFALTYGAQPGVRGLRATAPVADSAAQLSTFIDGVLAATGAEEVDIVGHSQGGMMPRYYVKFMDGADKVHTLVGLAPSNHGTTLGGLTGLARVWPGAVGIVASACPACAEQMVGSPLLSRLNAGADTVEGVDYTVIATRYDEVVTPYKSQFLSGPNVHNVTLQDLCPLDFTEHNLVSFDQVALNETLNALDPEHTTRTHCLSHPLLRERR